ncbi:hypothetical protein [Halobacillus salinus]|nr:hypothetical protein [Halobacillus salinus]
MIFFTLAGFFAARNLMKIMPVAIIAPTIELAINHNIAIHTF